MSHYECSRCGEKICECLSRENVTVSKKESVDNVNNPDHYKHESGIECIDITRHCNFNIGNAIKYLWRHGKKDPSKTIEDLKKAEFYIKDEIKRLELKSDLK